MHIFLKFTCSISFMREREAPLTGSVTPQSPSLKSLASQDLGSMHQVCVRSTQDQNLSIHVASTTAHQYATICTTEGEPNILLMESLQQVGTRCRCSSMQLDPYGKVLGSHPRISLCTPGKHMPMSWAS